MSFLVVSDYRLFDCKALTFGILSTNFDQVIDSLSRKLLSHNPVTLQIPV